MLYISYYLALSIITICSLDEAFFFKGEMKNVTAEVHELKFEKLFELIETPLIITF